MALSSIIFRMRVNMRETIPANWLHPSSLEEASLLQKQLASQVKQQDDFPSLQRLGGMDVSNNLFDPNQMVYAAAVVLDAKTLTIQSQASAAQKQPFPYIPGFLGFREAPVLLEAFQLLAIKPDLILVDGHGISHPRGLGIASHVGVLLDIPTIGVAKTILVGKPEGELGPEVGDSVPLMWKHQQIGVVLRTKARCNPLIISLGHRVSLKTAIDIVLKALSRYRLPEPTRQAHLTANACRKQFT